MYDSIVGLGQSAPQQLSNILEQLEAYEIPHSVKDSERLLAQHLSIKENFVNRFAEIDICIDSLCSYLQNESREGDAIMVSSLSTASVLSSVKL